MLEKIFNGRFRSLFETAEQLHENQYRFPSNRSIQELIFYKMAFLDKEYKTDLHRYAPATYLNVEKAFDCVWWDGLIY